MDLLSKAIQGQGAIVDSDVGVWDLGTGLEALAINERLTYSGQAVDVFNQIGEGLAQQYAILSQWKADGVDNALAVGQVLSQANALIQPLGLHIKSVGLEALAGEAGLDYALEGLMDAMKRTWGGLKNGFRTFIDDYRMGLKSTRTMAEELRARIQGVERALEGVDKDATLKNKEVTVSGWTKFFNGATGRVEDPSVKTLTEFKDTVMRYTDTTLLRDLLETSLKEAAVDDPADVSDKRVSAISDAVVKHYDLQLGDSDKGHGDAAHKSTPLFNMYAVSSRTETLGGLGLQGYCAKPTEGKVKHIYLTSLYPYSRDINKSFFRNKFTAMEQGELKAYLKALGDVADTLAAAVKDMEKNLDTLERYNKEMKKLQRVPWQLNLTMGALGLMTGGGTLPAMIVINVAVKMAKPIAAITDRTFKLAVVITEGHVNYVEKCIKNLK